MVRKSTKREYRQSLQEWAQSGSQPYGLRRSWQAVSELIIKVQGLHPATTTYDVWRNFATQGKIVLIQLFEDKDGLKDGNAKIVFSPPPGTPFWTIGSPNGTYMFTGDASLNSYEVRLSSENNRGGPFMIQSPVKKTTFYPRKMNLSLAVLDFGVMLYENSMMPMRTVPAEAPNDMSFTVDLLHHKIVIAFKIPLNDPRRHGLTDITSIAAIGQFDRTSRYMFQIPFSQLRTIYRVDVSEVMFALVISLDCPPQFLRKRQDISATHSSESLVWTEFDSWFRQTDIVYDPYYLQDKPVTLQKEASVIDIGRWTTYRFVFRRSEVDTNAYNMIKEALQDFNIELITLDKLSLVPWQAVQLWSLIDPLKSRHAADELRFLDDSNSPAFLPFEVRYQLEACISWGVLNEHNVTKDFLTKMAEIASEDSSKARTILEYITEQKKRIYDPMTILEDTEALEYTSRITVPNYCAYVRKATITPTRIYFNSPVVEPTNRVLRHYASENQDGRFLRVQFTDEISQGRINSCADKKRNDELFTRVYRTLSNGIRIGDRLYEFLAYGNSQCRENGAYFFCPTNHLSCNDIRQWMGDFSHINVVAKHAARIGQCFSTTRAINGLIRPEIVRIPDIESNGCCFTDGVGKISQFLAQMIAAELGLRSGTIPSAFQFRLGGCKGILVVSPDAKDKEVHIRKSQEKFTAIYNGLEVIKYSQFSLATLNRQTIPILSSLGVQDEVFQEMLSEQLSNYQNAVSNDTLALDLLSRYVDDNRTTLNIASMILNGFMTAREPFVLSLLHLWRTWSIKLLKEKAKIIVEKAAFVLGCVDETATLRGYTKSPNAGSEDPTEERLPQIFIQVEDRNELNQFKIIEGTCLLGRNPSLHPGDLRVVQAVNVPALHHLRNVVVFPQTGERDVPSMCSGGDLDGDEFFVIWDKALLPPEWNCDPMNYAGPAPRTLDRPVRVTDLMKFFVRYMKNDALPTIAHAHLALSDHSCHGVKDPKCLELAELHSKAVDYIKTGQPAEMPKRLRPSKWPHFMEKKYKSKDAVYHSEKVLGKLYDMVETVSFVPQWEEPFDERILRAYEPDDTILRSARQIKRKYDEAMLRIMAQQDIKTEFEVWSTFVLSKPRVGNDFRFQEVLAGISKALKDQFRKVCIEKAGSGDFPVLGPFVAAMYSVTKEELDLALAEFYSTKLVSAWEAPIKKLEPESMPIISFPWLFEEELGRIATGIITSHDLDDLDLVPLILKKNAGLSRDRQGREVDAEDHTQQEDGRLAEPHSSTKDQSPEETGIEDVVPRTWLDDFPGTSKADRLAYDSSLLGLHTVSDWIATQALHGHDIQEPLSDSSRVDDDTPVDRLTETPISTMDDYYTDDHSSRGFLGPKSLESYVLAKAMSEVSEEIIEEENFVEEEHLDLEESAFEKLARLVGT